MSNYKKRAFILDIVNGIKWEKEMIFEIGLTRNPITNYLHYDPRPILEEIDNRCEKRWSVQKQNQNSITVSFESKDDALQCSLALL